VLRPRGDSSASAAADELTTARRQRAVELDLAVLDDVHEVRAVALARGVRETTGGLIGSVVTAPLEGSLLVVFVFLLDAFAGTCSSAT
jgi:hypothetical protein